MARGSSGAAIISEERKEIIAIFVSVIGNSQGHISAVAIPVSRFKKFADEVQQGKHPLAKEIPNMSTNSSVD